MFVQVVFLAWEVQQTPFNYYRYNDHNRFFEQAEKAANEEGEFRLLQKNADIHIDAVLQRLEAA